jgi:preprotein translocase subunit SecG
VIEVVLMIHFIVALLVIVLVLLQQGKGASMGAAFGSGASATLFGSRGPASFLMKLTGFVVAIFFFTSLTLGYLASRAAHREDVMQTSIASQQHSGGAQQKSNIPLNIPEKKSV